VRISEIPEHDRIASPAIPLKYRLTAFFAAPTVIRQVFPHGNIEDRLNRRNKKARPAMCSTLAIAHRADSRQAIPIYLGESIEI
jgi:hypothetical protein